MKPAKKAFLEGLKALYLEAPPSVVQDLSKRAEAALIEAEGDAEAAAKDYAGLREFQAKFIAADSELRAVKAQLGAAEDRIYDLLLPGDGYAEKEARKYLQEHRPDLMALLDAADKADG